MRWAMMMVVGWSVGLAGCDDTAVRAPNHNIGDRLKLTGEAWACDSKARDDLDKQHDRKAFGELMHRFHQANRCLPLQPGTVVDVISMALFSGRTEVRVKESPESRWMMSIVLDRFSTPAGSWRTSDAGRR